MEVIADGWFHMTNTDDPPGVTKSLNARTFSGVSGVFSGTHKAVESRVLAIFHYSFSCSSFGFWDSSSPQMECPSVEKEG